MSKLVTFAGVSRLNGVLKFRVANDVKRIDVLRKAGHTEVEMQFLNTEMTKSQAAKRLIATNFANGREEILAVLVAEANDDNPFTVAKPSKPRTVVAKNAVVKTSVKSQVYPEIELTPKQAAKIRAEFMKKLKAAYEAN
jgi:hypothetical protein